MILKTLKDITITLFIIIKNAILRNLQGFINLFKIILPIGCLIYGRFLNNKEIKMTIICIIFIYVLIFYIEQFLNRIGKGSKIPVPIRRFTSEDEFGEISIENERLSELIIYINDVEDWLTKKGLL